MDTETIGDRLRQIRKRLGYSQEQFSKELGMLQNSYCRFEKCTRQPNLEVLNLLMKKYKINLNWLIGGEGEMFKEPPEILTRYEEKIDKVKELFIKIESIMKEVK